MSLNQITENTTKKWLIPKTFDLTVDGVIKVTNPDSRTGDILTCVAPGIAKFAPQHVVPNISYNYYFLNTGLNAVAPGFFEITSFAGYTNPDFTNATANSLECVNTGVYWVSKKITINAPNNGGVKSVTEVNNVNYLYSQVNVQWNQTGYGYGLTAGYLLSLTAGDVIKELYTPTGNSYQNDVTSSSCNIQFVKVG